MRYLLTFIIGFISFFYLSALIKQLFNLKVHSLIGIVVIIFSIFLGIFGSGVISYPLNILAAYFLAGAGLGIIIFHLLSQSYILSEKIEKNFVTKHETKFERFLEILPGALTWLALTSPVWLSFTLPFAVAYVIIIADVYWLFNSIKIAFLIILAHRKVEQVSKIDWHQKLKTEFSGEFKEYYHLLVLPTYTEGIEILGPAFDAISTQHYPKENIFLAVGFESRENERNPEKIANTKKHLSEIEKSIGGVFTSIHPFGLEGEVPGPGTNRNWMINNALKEFTKLKIKPEQVLITTLDADFVIHPQFLAGTMHKYLSTSPDKRNKSSYTGAIFFFNNYWQVPAPMRLIATGTAFWQMSEMLSSDKYINYSSMSINLQSLLDLGLWPKDKVNDDSGFYWKAYYYFKGQYKVIPHFLPINGDAVLDTSTVKTFQNQYLQLKRWAYGVEHIPFIVKSYFTEKDLDFWDKTDKLTFVLWSYLKWGTLALFISFGGLLIPIFNPAFSDSVVAHNSSVISSWILTAAFCGLASTIYVHEKMAPPRPKSWSLLQKIWSYIQWALIPVILVTIATIPAIDAQTSLMLGRYLEYRVTNKARLPST